MIDVNTIIGEPIQALNNTVIIPISKVGFGFAAGGSEFNDETVNSYNRKEKEENIKYRLPFGGGSGAGVNITPVAFLIVQNDTVKLLEATHTSVLDKLVEYVPDVIDKINQLFNKKLDDKTEKSYIDFDEESDEINWNKNENIQDDVQNEIKEIFSQDKKINKSNKNLEDKINEIKRENNNSKE